MICRYPLRQQVWFFGVGHVVCGGHWEVLRLEALAALGLWGFCMGCFGVAWLSSDGCDIDVVGNEGGEEWALVVWGGAVEQ